MSGQTNGWLWTSWIVGALVCLFFMGVATQGTKAPFASMFKASTTSYGRGTGIYFGGGK